MKRIKLFLTCIILASIAVPLHAMGPSAVDETLSICPVLSSAIDVLANDQMGSGSLVPSTVSVIDGPSFGSVIVDSNGIITYTPSPNFLSNGTDNFTYQVCDVNSLCDSAIVTLIAHKTQSFTEIDSASFGSYGSAVSWKNISGTDYLAVGGNNSSADVTIFEFDGSMLTTVTSTNFGSGAFSVDWITVSGTDYLAVGGNNSSADVTIFEFDGSSLITTYTQNFGSAATDVSWTTTNSTPYLAVSGLASGDDLVVYEFDPTAGTKLIKIDGIDTPLAINAVSWITIDGIPYVATVGFDAPRLRVYEFDPTGGTLTLNASDNVGTPRFVKWTTIGSSYYLAIGNSSFIRVYEFDPTGGTLTTIDSVSASVGSNCADWLTFEGKKYLAAGTGSFARLYLFDGSTLKEESSISFDTPQGLEWTSIGGINYLAITGEISSSGIVKIYSFTPPPVVNNDAITMLQLPFTTIDVLANDMPGESSASLLESTVSVVDGPSNGSTLVNTSNGNITYTPSHLFTGKDEFTYQVFDSNCQCNSAVVELKVERNDPLDQKDSISYSTGTVSFVNGTDWTNISGTDYLAVAGDMSVPNQVIIYSFDGSSLSQVTSKSFGLEANAVAWVTISGTDYLAVAGNNGSTDIVIYEFSGGSLSSVDTASFQGIAGSLSWINIGGTYYLAAGGSDTSGDQNVKVYRFDGTLSFLTDDVFEDFVLSVDWILIDGTAYLAVGGNDTVGTDDLRIYEFTPGGPTLTQVAEDTFSSFVSSVAWKTINSINYLVAGGRNSPDDLIIYTFDADTDTLTQIDSASFGAGGSDNISSVSWTNSGKDKEFIAVSGDIASGSTRRGVLRIYSFDNSSLFFENSRNINSATAPGSASMNTTSWTTINGIQFLAAGGGETPGGPAVLYIYCFDAPIAIDDLVNMCENQSSTIDVLANDCPSNGASFVDSSVSILSGPSFGSTMINANGTITYTPQANFTGSDSFIYRVADTHSLSDYASVSINVFPIPSLFDQFISICASTQSAINVLANNPSSVLPSTVTVIDGPTSGSIVGVNSTTGAITYKAGGGSGSDSFTYQGANSGGCTNSAVVSFEVLAPPTAVDECVSICPNTQSTIDVLANDTGGSGALIPSSVTVVDGPSSGSIISINPTTGAITYQAGSTPGSSDSFTYQVSNEFSCVDSAIVSIKVLEGVSAVDDLVITGTGQITAIDVLSNDGGGILDTSSVSVIDGPITGTIVSVNPTTGDITYQASNTTNTDQFTYQVRDACSNLDSAVVTVIVIDTISALDTSISICPSTQSVIDILDHVVAGGAPVDPASVTVIDGPTTGSIISINPTTGYITYQSNGPGMDAFTYKVRDDSSAMAQATVAITVLTPPSTVDEFLSICDNTQTSIDVLSNDSGGSGTLVPSTVTVIDGPTTGSIISINPTTGAITYQTGGVGLDSFTYQVADEFGCTNSAQVRLEVLNAPSARDEELSICDNTQTIIDVQTTGGIPSTVTVIDGPTTGSIISINPTTGAITYQGGNAGPDAFTYQISNEISCTDSAVITVIVVESNFARNETVSVCPEVNQTINVVANDTFSDSPVDPSSLEIITMPSQGTIVGIDLNTGSVIYKSFGEGTTDNFSYKVRNLVSCTDSAVVTVVATTPPSAVDDLVSINITTSSAIDVLANDAAGSFPLDPSSVTVTDSPSLGTIVGVDTTTGAITYQAGSVIGTDHFTYQVRDTLSCSDSAIVTLVLTGTAIGSALDECLWITQGDIVVVDVLTHAVDPDTDTVSITQEPLGDATTEVLGAGLVEYTGDPDIVSKNSFKFVYRNMSGVLSSDNTVTVQILAHDEPCTEIYASGNTLCEPTLQPV